MLVAGEEEGAGVRAVFLFPHNAASTARGLQPPEPLDDGGFFVPTYTKQMMADAKSSIAADSTYTSMADKDLAELEHLLADTLPDFPLTSMDDFFAPNIQDQLSVI